MKFFGAVGYGHAMENPSDSGVWVDQMIEVLYYGDVIRNTSKLDDGENLNADITVNNSISIIADDYAIQHFSKIKYVMWAGIPWTVTTVEVKNPRLILSLGVVYNGPRALN